MSRDVKYHSGSTDGKAPLNGDPLSKARSSYDLIVIGSGLAGLTAANVIAKAGFKVCLLEQHYNFGGMATWFKRRGGHVFDVSLHGFPVGMKKTCRKYWNRTISDAIIPLDSVSYDNPQFSFETEFTREDFTRKLVENFGLPVERVEGFYQHLRAMNFYDDSRETTGEMFEEWFPGRNDVHRLLMEPISYANGSTLDDPAISYGIVFSNFMSKGVYTFSGGTDLLIGQMKAELRRNNVDLFSRVQVDQIIVRDGRVRGVVANGKEITASTVLSNANIKTTISKLVGEEHFEPEFARGAAAIRLNNSSTQVYMGVREGETIPFTTDLLFTSTRKTFDSAALCDMQGESRTFSFYGPKTRPGVDRYTIVSSTNANHLDWKALSDKQYAAEKELLSERTLRCLEGYQPGIREKLDHIEVSTPRTFEFYTQHATGSSFGTKFEGLQFSMDLHKQIAGLYHAGSVGIIMSGWLGAANYGVIAANKVDEYLHSLREVTA